MREQISLNGTWQLKGTASYVPLRDKSMETGKPLEGVTGWMDAQVPGGVARALYQADYIDHPYVDMNSLKCEWIENRWWIYRREFDRRDIPAHRKTVLHGQCRSGFLCAVLCAAYRHRQRQIAIRTGCAGNMQQPRAVRCV